MKKRIFSVICILLVCAAALCGCRGALYGNDRSTVGLMSVSSERGAVVLRASGATLSYSPAEKTLSALRTETNIDLPVPVLSGDTFPQGRLEYAEGYEKLAEEIGRLSEDPNRPITAFAYRAADGTVYGFCNIYSGSTGLFSGGGQIDADKIVRACLFHCESGGSFLLDGVLERCVAIAYDGTSAIFFSDRFYYSRTGEETVKICEDEAYDTGMSHYGSAWFAFGSGYCLLYFKRGNADPALEYERYVLVTMAGEVLATLRVPWLEQEK